MSSCEVTADWVLPLTLDEVFTYEMELLGYSFEKTLGSESSETDR